MSVKIMSMVWERSDLDPYERLVMLSLADHADDDGYCYPSISRIVARTGMKERGVQVVLRRLRDRGDITIEISAGRRGANLYKVSPTPAPDAPRTGCTPAPDAPPPRTGCTPTPAPDAPEPSYTTINEPSSKDTGGIDAAFAAYNEAAAQSGWPIVRILSKPRRAALAQRLLECGGIDGWKAAIKKAQASDLCCGKNDRGWIANFDFLTRQSSFAKLIEGNYDNRKPVSNNAPIDLRAISARIQAERAAK